MPVLTTSPPRNDLTPRRDPKDDIPIAVKRTSPEPPKATEKQAAHSKPKEKTPEPVKEPSTTDKPKAKSPTPEPESEGFKARKGSEFYNIEVLMIAPELFILAHKCF